MTGEQRSLYKRITVAGDLLMEIEMIEPNTIMKTEDGFVLKVIGVEYRNVFTNADHKATERRLTGYICRMVRKDGTLTKAPAVIEPSALLPL